MPLIRNDDLVRVDLPATGEYAMVKRVLSRGDMVTVQQAVTKGSKVNAASELDLDVGTALDAAEFATLDVAVKVLCVSVKEGAEPEVIDVTPEALRQLDEASVDCIKAKLNELYPAARSDDERKNLNGRSAQRSKVTGGSRSN